MKKMVVSIDDLYAYDDLSDLKTRHIVQELTLALNKNSVSKIKEIKYEYGQLKEFAKAKKILNQKCKEVWNPFESKNLVLPSEAMKCLGVTNQPSLDFLLGDSIRFFEKNNGIMTSKIINNILSNDNLSYSMDDIHNYIANLVKKENCKINTKTTEYLITNQKYNKQKLSELGVNIKETVHLFILKDRLKRACQKLQQTIHIK